VAQAVRIPVNRRTLADIETISSGAFAPLDGFLARRDYARVLSENRLESGALWPIPITLAVDETAAQKLGKAGRAELDFEGQIVAALNVSDVFAYDKQVEAERVFKTTDPKHPGVAILTKQKGHYVGGKLVEVQLPKSKRFAPYNLTPQETRSAFQKKGWKTVVGFQTRNPIHRAHEQITKTALETVDGLLIHPLVGEVKADDIPAEVRMKSYEVLIKNYYPQDRVMLAAYPGNMFYAGPREALLHALVRKNYGCTHFIVGRDHAGVGQFYGHDEAQEFLKTFDVKELGITPMYFGKALNVSGSEIRAALAAGHRPSPEQMRPEVADVLIKALKK
jgi:sulfate adenylyltransferase